jgi:hypothetical protein
MNNVLLVPAIQLLQSHHQSVPWWLSYCVLKLVACLVFWCLWGVTRGGASRKVGRHARWGVTRWSTVQGHMKLVHQIDPNTGFMPDPSPLTFALPFKAAAVTGSSTVVAHTCWQEAELQASLVDWMITKDVGFLDVTSSKTQGLLT